MSQKSPQWSASILFHFRVAELVANRDRVLFIRKMNATLQREGRIDRVAKALGMSAEALKREMHLGTSIAALIERPPDAPVTTHKSSPQPIAPAEK